MTFTQKDGALEFPTFEADNAGDIWYQFKTTTSDGVMIHCVGSVVSDFVEIRLFRKNLYFHKLCGCLNRLKYLSVYYFVWELNDGNSLHQME